MRQLFSERVFLNMAGQESRHPVQLARIADFRKE